MTIILKLWNVKTINYQFNNSLLTFTTRNIFLKKHTTHNGEIDRSKKVN